MAENHELVLWNRQKMSLTGIVHVDSFNEQEIVLQTAMGSLVLRGEGLAIVNFDMGEGKLGVEGSFRSAEYYEASSAKGGKTRRKLLERLLR